MTMTRKRNRAPTHPGEILRDDALPALRLTVSGAARQLRVSRQMLHRILSAEAPVTVPMALRLGKLCRNGPRLWLNLQREHDLWHAEREMKSELRAIPTNDVA